MSFEEKNVLKMTLLYTIQTTVYCLTSVIFSCFWHEVIKYVDCDYLLVNYYKVFLTACIWKIFSLEAFILDTFTAVQMDTISFTVVQMDTISFTIVQMNTISFTVVQMDTISFTVGQMNTISFTVVQMDTISFLTLFYVAP